MRTVKKWQEEFNVGRKYNLREDFVTAIQCKLFARYGGGSHMLQVSVVTTTAGFDKVQSE